MRFSKKSWLVISAFFMAFVFVPASHAQLNSGASTVNLNAPLAESLTVSAGGGVTAATTALLTPEEIDKAAGTTVKYRPPGS